MTVLTDLAYTAGWLVFLYLGGAGAYELFGGRRYRASLLLAVAFLWIVLTLVFFRYTDKSDYGVMMLILYFVACFVLVRKVHADLGKPDIR
jgi:Mn2+/Fe2+ NRAMP family transporter